jgi:hypothetical protein
VIAVKTSIESDPPKNMGIMPIQTRVCEQSEAKCI